MANTFTQVYIQIVFSVKHRAALVRPEWCEELHKYITGIVQNKGHMMLAINSMPDHIHIFIVMKPHVALSDLVRDIKAHSSKWINENKVTRGRFEWQEGFGAFSYSQSQIDNVVKYVLRQREHHNRKTFKEEYVEFLKSFAIAYDPKYVFGIED